MMKSWKTTVAGLATIAMGVVLIAIGQVAPGLACIPVGLGLIAAKDSNVTGGTTEQ